MRFIVCIGSLAVLVGAVSNPGSAQSSEVAGVVVTGGSAQPLPGVVIVLPGNRLGATTDATGRFRITGLPGARGTEIVLRANKIGYRAQSVIVPLGSMDVRISMAGVTVQLNQVIVTGTATGAQARSIGTATGLVKMADILENAPPPTMQTILRSNVAGVNMSSGPGNVGTGAAIRIRGAGSLTLGSTPLIYVDGVRIDNDQNAGLGNMRNGSVSRFNDLNPDEIQSMEVIKGPAAATLFGTDASAGVIQIVTKKGRSGPATWDFIVREGVTYLSDPIGRWPAVYDRSTTPCSGCVLLPGGVRELNVLKADIQNGDGLPWSNGHNHTYGLSARGGAGAATYFFSLEQDREEGYVPWNWKNKSSARLNLDLVANPTVRVSSSLGFLRSITRFDSPGPYPAEIESSIYWGSPAQAGTRSHGWFLNTPEALATVVAKDAYDRFTGSMSIQHNPTTWLTQRLTFGADLGSSVPTRLFPRSPLGTTDYYGPLSLGHVEVTNRSVSNTNVDYGAAATFHLLSDLLAETAVGGQYYVKQMHVEGATGDQFPAPGGGTVSSSAVKTGFEDFVENKSLGLYAQEQFGWKNRRFITVAMRGDANSAFGKNYAQVLYPKVSASWVLQEEPFWHVGWLNTLRLRSAWGRAGRQPDTFASQRLYAPFTAAGDKPGLTTDAVGNPDLKPEVGEELELGFDASALDDRFSVRFTFYNKNTKDAILRKSVPPSSGFSGSQFVNAGMLNNRGTELELDGRILERSKLSWNLGLKFSTNNSKVVSLGGLPTIITSTQQQKEDYPIGAVFIQHVVSATLDANGKVTSCLAEATPEQGGGTVPCSQSQAVYRGPALPTWEGAVNTTVQFFGNFSLYAHVDFQGGYTKVSGDLGASHLFFFNSLAAAQGKDPLLVAMKTAVPGSNYIQAGVLKGGFAKLREVSINYTIPKRVLGWSKVSRATIGMSAYNLANLWVAQRGIFGRNDTDPELSAQQSSTSDFSAIYQTLMPPASSVGLSLRLTY